MMVRTYLLRLVLGMVAALSFGAARTAFGATLEVEAFATIGRSVAPTEPVWIEYIIRLRNQGAGPARGTAELAHEDGPHQETPVSRTAFAVESRSHTTVRSIFLRDPSAFAPLLVRLRDAAGTVVAEAPVAGGDLRGIVVVDLDPSGRIRALLRDSELPVPRSALGYAEPRAIVVTSPKKSAATGLPIVPALPAGYALAVLVVAPTSLLTALPASELRALGDWVLSGGALAVTVDSPADLGQSPLREWLGGEVVETAPSQGLLGQRNFAMVPAPESDTSAENSLLTTRLAPTEAVQEALRGYGGAGVHESEWGAAASYGLGEVHLLAFKPTAAPFVTDPWVRHELEMLIRAAVVRRLQLALPHGRPQLHGGDGIRRALDPNQTMRWTLLAAVGLLLVYAVVAGPVNFSHAAGRSRPLMAIPRLLGAAAMTSVLVIALGILNRGVRSRSRHLTLVEIGAGINRGAAVRFRGFYTSRAQELRIAASSSRAVLAAASELHPLPYLEVDPRGLVLSGLRTSPWQTTVVRDDGFLNLGAGIALVNAREGKVVAVNRSGRDLVGVVLKQPGDEALYFHARVRDGERVVASEGHRLAASVRRTPSPFGLQIGLLGQDEFSEHVERTETGATMAWRALQGNADTIDWWPSDVPVLIGQIKGGEGRLVDSGVELDSDRVFVRVIGYGGSQ